MHSLRAQFPFSMMSLASGTVAVLLIAYIGLIAVVMSYGALTVEFSQSVRNDEAAIATLESGYLANVAHITNIDYIAAGYTKPLIEVFVRAESSTALR